MRSIAVGLAILIAAFPWMFGGTSYVSQTVVAGIVVVLAFVFWLRRAFFPSAVHDISSLPTGIIPFAALLVLGLIQLGLPKVPPVRAMHHAALADLIADEPIPPTAELGLKETPSGTIHPLSTQRRVAQIMLLIVVFLVARDAFSTYDSQRTLLICLTFSGAALAAVGIAQLLGSNDKLLWIEPLRYFTTPFGPFVSKTSAASFLCICLAANIALLMADPHGLNLRQSEDSEVDSAPSRRNPLSILMFLSSGWSLTLVLTGILMICGVMLSSSRAGITAMCAGLAIGLWLLPWRRGKGLLVAGGFTVLLLASVLLANWTGRGANAWERIKTLAQPEQAFSGRWQHWKDSVQSLKDYPLLGTGLGTYRYANEPYQRNSSDSSYWNADNQYVESAVEGGVVGAILFLLLGVFPLWTSLAALRDEAHLESRPVAVTLLLSVACLAIVSVAHFAILSPPVAVVMTVLAGGLAGSMWQVSRPSGWMSAVYLSPERAFSLLLWGVILVTGTFSTMELGKAAAIEQARLSLPVALTYRNCRLDQAEKFNEHLARVLPLQPDDSELRVDLARLRYHIVRLRLLDEMRSVTEGEKSPPSDEFLWKNTNLLALHRLVQVAENQADEEGAVRASLERHPVYRDLTAVRHELEEALKYNSIDCYSSRQLALLDSLEGKPRTEVAHRLRHSLWACPRSSENLLLIATDAVELELTQELASAVNRVLQFCPSVADKVPAEMFSTHAGLPTARN